MTLFEAANPSISVFAEVLDTFFAGERDALTLKLLNTCIQSCEEEKEEVCERKEDCEKEKEESKEDFREEVVKEEVKKVPFLLRLFKKLF